MTAFVVRRDGLVPVDPATRPAVVEPA